MPASLPSGFVESVVARDLSSPTAMEIAPDGDVWVIEQGGAVKRFREGTTSADIVGRINTLGLSFVGERGLLGIAFDPDYINNKHVFLYYTSTASPNPHNRVIRCTVNDDDATDYFFEGTNTNVNDAGSSGAPTNALIFKLNALSAATNHNGGAIHFGPDGKLYIAAGDNANGANAQSLNNVLGKILRINSDGTIPEDNPFFDEAAGKQRAIWALGLRNPFTFAFQPGTGEMFINDVGQNSFEEINRGGAGLNFGWPGIEGNSGNSPDSPGTYRGPLYTYSHGSGTFQGFAITGGAFYNPDLELFPAEFSGDYFFADFANDWMHVIDPDTEDVREFATGAGSPVDLRVADDGSLLYLSRGGNKVFRVRFTGSNAPTISEPPQDATVSAGLDATFTVSATGQDLTFQWQHFDGSDWVDLADDSHTSGTTTDTLTIHDVQNADAGEYRVVVANSIDTEESLFAVLTVTPNQPPAATIFLDAGLTNGKFVAGTEVFFSGQGLDPEDGALDASHFTWRVDYITSITPDNPGGEVRPFIADFSGVTSSSFTPDTTSAYTLPNVAYRITLTVTDDNGQETTVSRDVRPRTSLITLKTKPSGLGLTVDGQPFTGPVTFRSIEGFERPIGAESSFLADGVEYSFVSWSDGGAATHTIVTPTDDATFKANFTPTFLARINFQSGDSEGHPLFLTDLGAPFGDRGNGLNYGWNSDTSASALNRNSPRSPDERFDTLIEMQPGAIWEIEVPDGFYQVKIAAGDARAFDSLYRINVEDTLAIDGTPTSSQRWLESTLTVEVTDGRLTISSAAGAIKNKICFVKITKVEGS